MDTYEEIAQQYVDSFGEVLSGYKYNFIRRKDFLTKVYYDFTFVDLQGNIPKEPPIAGGAPGFTIDKRTYKAEVISWGNLAELEQQQKELEDVYNKLNNADSNIASLLWLKSKYALNSVQLLRIKRALNKTSFTKANVLDELNELILKNR